MNPRVIGVAGGTASGKTTVAHALVQALGDAVLVEHDRYYRPVPPGVDPGRWNFDHPDALESELLVGHLAELRAGRAVDAPRYDFAHHARAGADRVEPRPWVIVEGILVFSDPSLRASFDHRFFVHAPADLRLARRLRRDIAERGRDPLGVLDQYLVTVRPMHEQHVEPTRAWAERVLDGTWPVGETVAAVLAELGVGL